MALKLTWQPPNRDFFQKEKRESSNMKRFAPICLLLVFICFTVSDVVSATPRNDHSHRKIMVVETEGLKLWNMPNADMGDVIKVLQLGRWLLIKKMDLAGNNWIQVEDREGNLGWTQIEGDSFYDVERTMGENGLGHETVYDSNGTIRSTSEYIDAKNGHYLDAQNHGRSVSYYKGGTIEHEGEYKYGDNHGRSVWYNKNGTIDQEAHFKRGKRDGKTILYHENGEKKQTRYYIDGKVHGKYISYHENGAIEHEGQYLDDKAQGKFIWYYADGTVEQEIEYDDGEKEGVFIGYYADGTVEQEGKYKNGEKEGEYIWYYADGTVEQEGDYKSGVEEGKYIWYDTNGNKEAFSHYKSGNLHGLSVGYYSNKKKKYAEHYKRGTLNGRAVYYHANGKKEKSGIFNEFGAHGWWNFYDENGKKINEVKYSNGSIVEGAERFKVNWGKVGKAALFITVAGLKAYSESDNQQSQQSPNQKSTIEVPNNCPICNSTISANISTKMIQGKWKKVYKCWSGHEFVLGGTAIESSKLLNPTAERHDAIPETCPECGKRMTNSRLNVYKCTSGHKFEIQKSQYGYYPRKIE